MDPTTESTEGDPAGTETGHIPSVQSTAVLSNRNNDNVEKENDPEHGLDGHNGFRCMACAMLGSGPKVMLYPDTATYWQGKQIAWQEECDIQMAKYDQMVEDHWPVHTEHGPCDCPKRPALPTKPLPPSERRHADLD